jgi:hypothetical protein
MHLNFRAKPWPLLLLGSLALECACHHLDNSRRLKENMNTSVLEITADQLRTAQAKLTFLGPQSKPVPTVVFFIEGHLPSMEAFIPWHRSRRPYENDDLPYTVKFAVSRAEFMRLLQAERGLLAGSSSSGGEFISFTVVVETPSGGAGEEFTIREPLLEEFYKTAIGAMNPDNSAARQGLSGQATKMGLNL